MRIFIIIFFNFCSFFSHSQTRQDSSILFEKAKGQLHQPLTNFIKVPPIKVSGNDKNLPGKMVSYICRNADSVRSIFAGKIVSIAEVNGAYLVITNFGKYSITYYGMCKPLLKEGSIIKRNQFISTLSKTSFGQYFLTVQFYKDNTEVNPGDWFK